MSTTSNDLNMIKFNIRSFNQFCSHYQKLMCQNRAPIGLTVIQAFSSSDFFSRVKLQSVKNIFFFRFFLRVKLQSVKNIFFFRFFFESEITKKKKGKKEKRKKRKKEKRKKRKKLKEKRIKNKLNDCGG